MASKGRGHIKRSTQGHRITQAKKKAAGIEPEDSGIAVGEILDPRTGVVVLGGLTFTPNPDWHYIARMIWDAALSSPGVLKYYQPTDLAVLYNTCENLSIYRNQAQTYGKIPAAALASISDSMSSLLLTEGDRRRAQIELTNGSSEASSIDAMERSMRLLAAYIDDRETG